MSEKETRHLSELERDAELAIIISVANLPSGDRLANARAIPEAAAKRLKGSVALAVPMEELRKLVKAAAERLQADGFLEAPSDPKRSWRLIQRAANGHPTT